MITESIAERQVGPSANIASAFSQKPGPIMAESSSSSISMRTNRCFDGAGTGLWYEQEGTQEDGGDSKGKEQPTSLCVCVCAWVLV